MVKELLKKKSPPTQSSNANFLATWKANTTLALRSGPSGITEESVSKTDNGEGD